MMMSMKTFDDLITRPSTQKIIMKLTYASPPSMAALAGQE